MRIELTGGAGCCASIPRHNLAVAVGAMLEGDRERLESVMIPPAADDPGLAGAILFGTQLRAAVVFTGMIGRLPCARPVTTAGSLPIRSACLTLHRAIPLWCRGAVAGQVNEVFKRILQQRSRHDALQAIAVMRQGNVVDFDEPIALLAARLSIQHHPPMADSYILATTRSHRAMLWTQVADFEGLAGVRYRTKQVDGSALP